MDKCTICGSQESLYKKRMICKKCYQKEYAKKYYKNNSDKLKNNSSKTYYNNHERELERRKKYREINQFDNKRTKILVKFNYTCSNCNTEYDDSDLVVHHKDRLGRGSKVKNNDDNNLTVLCRKCHASEHHQDTRKAFNDKYKGKWAIKYDNCVECGTSDVPHGGKGMCDNCYARHLRTKNNDKVKEKWSSKFDSCTECNTKEIPYGGKGMCKKCYDKSRRKN